jgi:multiple sugar transport system substrate-binding protein
MSGEQIPPVSDALSNRRMSRREALTRASALGVSVTSLGALLAACGSSSSGSGATSGGTTAGGAVKGQISMLKGPHAANETQIEQKIIAGFTKDHPGVKVNFSTYDWAQMNAQLNTAFAGGSPPDIVYLTDATYPFYAAQGVLEDMTPYVRAAAYQSEWNAIQPFSWDLATYQGKVWGVPALGAVYLIVVNRDLVAKTGVTDWDTSYARMQEAAIKATRGNVYGFSVRTSVNDYAYWDWFPYLHNAGADVLDAAKTAPGLENPDSVAAMQFLIDMHQRYKVTPPVGEVDWQGQKDLFKAGRIAIHHDDSTLITELQRKDPGFAWDIAMVPPGPKKQTVMGNFGFLCISKGSKNKQAAWEYIKYWTSAPVVSSFSKQTTLQVVRRDVDVARLWKGDPILARIQSEFVPKVQGIQTDPRLQQMLTAFWPNIEAAYRGSSTGAQALAAASKAIQGAM